MRASLFLLLFLSFSSQFVFGQKKAKENDDYYYWNLMSDVKIKTKFDPNTGDIGREPIFGRKIAKYSGKEITLKGYIIPADMTGGSMTLSMFPYSSCYFCGGAGPETVIEIVADGPIIYRMDRPITLKGKLKLNKEDPFRLIYILEDASYAK